MKNPTRFFAIFVLLLILIVGCQSTSPSSVIPTLIPTYTIQPPSAPILTTVTYVGNSGFLIAVGDKKILIDSLFEGFPDSYHLPSTEVEDILNATPPFDQIDLVLATHSHADHFDAVLVRQYLDNNPEVTFASTAQVTALLPDIEDRVITLDANTGNPAKVDINGIHVEAIYLSHGIPSDGSVEVINNAYLVKVNGVIFFHSGDMYPSLLPHEIIQTNNLSGQNIDFAFMQHFRLSNPAFPGFMNDVIQSKYVIASHYELAGEVEVENIKQYYPDVVIFSKEMQTWQMPGK